MVDTNGWSRYEKLVLAKLDEVGRKAEVLSARVDALERSTSPERFSMLIAQALEDKEARGWSLRAQLISAFVALLALGTFLLTAYQAVKK